MTDEPATRHLGSAYVLDSRRGAGAQGEVWAGRHLATGEVLAFKVLRTELVDSPGVVDRFIKERSTLLRVRSPFVVSVRDIVIEGSTFAIVMDYVGGGDLRDLLRAEGALAPGTVAGLGSGVARGLAAVHRAGVVHRDVKPANILLERSGRRPAPEQESEDEGGTILSDDGLVRPRLADFGVARICDTLASGSLTGPIGTPLYMAPEILSMQPPTSAADVYSLGVVLYEMVCGTPPFVGQVPQLLAQHARHDPGRPGGVPEPLWDVIRAMLSKQPSHRPEAEAVARYLEELRDGLAGLLAAPVLAEPPLATPSPVPYDWDAGASPQVEHSGTTGPTGLTRVDDARNEDPALAPTRLVDTTTTLPASQPVTSAASQAGYGWLPPESAQPSSAATPAVSAAQSSDTGSLVAYQVTAGQGSAGSDSRPQRRRRRWWALVAAFLVVAVVAAGAGGLLWWRARSTAAYEGWLAALPQGRSVQEDLRVSDISAAVTSPRGDMLAVRSSAFNDDSYGDWLLYDLSLSRARPVWSGDCGTGDDAAVFWSDTALLCGLSSTRPTLVARDGSTSTAPVSDFQWVGADSERAVIVAEEYGSGDLVAYDSQGKKAWQLQGEYEGGMVRNGYVLTYESGLDEIQVLSAQTGGLLTSARADRPDFPDVDSASDFPSTQADDSSTLYPGGFNILTGPEAFSRVTEGRATIYEADGTEAATVSGSLPLKNDFATSVPMDAKALASAYATSAESTSATYAFGPDGDIRLEVDTKKCAVTANGKKLEIPARASGEDCVVRPLGGLRGGLVLLQVGEPSTSSDVTGDAVIALSLSDGKQAWQVRGTLDRVVPGTSEDAGSRLLVAHTGSSRVDAVVVSVAS